MPKYWRRILLFALLSGIFIAVFGTLIGLSVDQRFLLNLLSGFIIGGYYGRKESSERNQSSP